MPNYRITFDENRIGRSRTVGPVSIQADTEDILETKILKHARPFLRSRDVEVLVDLETTPWRGMIMCGMHAGASFSIEAE
jgi:hypothetical protein